MNSQLQLYRQLDVWKREGMERSICCRCFEVLAPKGESLGFCVQSADIFYRAKGPDQSSAFERRFFELLSEEAPDVRSQVHKTLNEAIESFDQTFAK